jgi:hypothetical protein
MLIPSLPHMHFFHFSGTCYLGSNGFTNLWNPLFSLILFWRAAQTLVLECYDSDLKVSSLYNFGHNKCKELLPKKLQFNLDKNPMWPRIIDVVSIEEQVLLAYF